MVVLLGIAAVVGGGAWYDRAVLIPDADAKIKRVMQLQTLPGEDAREPIASAAGMPPSSTEQLGSFTIDEYRFPRILPFLEPRVCSVVFNELGGVVETYAGPMSKSDRDAMTNRGQ